MAVMAYVWSITELLFGLYALLSKSKINIIFAKQTHSSYQDSHINNEMKFDVTNYKIIILIPYSL